jgi:hypothetical protein
MLTFVHLLSLAPKSKNNPKTQQEGQPQEEDVRKLSPVIADTRHVNQSSSRHQDRTTMKPVAVESSGFGDDWSAEGGSDWQNDRFGSSSDWNRTPTRLSDRPIPFESKKDEMEPYDDWDVASKDKSSGENFWQDEDDWHTSTPSKPIESASKSSTQSSPSVKSVIHVEEEGKDKILDYATPERTISKSESASSMNSSSNLGKVDEFMDDDADTTEKQTTQISPSSHSGFQDWDFDAPLSQPLASSSTSFSASEVQLSETEWKDDFFHHSPSATIVSNSSPQKMQSKPLTPTLEPVSFESDLDNSQEAKDDPFLIDEMNSAINDTQHHDQSFLQSNIEKLQALPSSLWENEEEELFSSQTEPLPHSVSSNPSAFSLDPLVFDNQEINATIDPIQDTEELFSEPFPSKQSLNTTLDEFGSVDPIQSESPNNLSTDVLQDPKDETFSEHSLQATLSSIDPTTSHLLPSQGSDMFPSNSFQDALEEEPHHPNMEEKTPSIPSIPSTPTPSSLASSSSSLHAMNTSSLSSSSISMSVTPIDDSKEALRRLSIVQSKLKEQSKLIDHLTEEKQQLQSQAKKLDDEMRRRETDLKSQLSAARDRISSLEKDVSSSSLSSQSSYQVEIDRIKEEHKKSQEAVVNHLTDQVNRYAKLNDENQSRYEEKKRQLIVTLEEKKRFISSLETQVSDLKDEQERYLEEERLRIEVEKKKEEERRDRELKELEERVDKKEKTLTQRLDAALDSIAKKDDRIQFLEHENAVLTGEVAMRKNGEAEEAKRAWQLKETMEHSLEHSTAQLQARIEEMQAQRDSMAQEQATLQAQLAKVHAKSERSNSALQSQLDERLDQLTQIQSEYADYKTRAAAHLKQLENQLEMEKRSSLASSSRSMSESSQNDITLDRSTSPSSHAKGSTLNAIKESANQLLEMFNSGLFTSLLASVSSQSSSNLSNDDLIRLKTNLASISTSEQAPLDENWEKNSSFTANAVVPLASISNVLASVTQILQISQSNLSRMHLELEELKTSGTWTGDKSQLVGPSSIALGTSPTQVQLDRMQEDLIERETKIEELQQMTTVLQRDLQQKLTVESDMEKERREMEKMMELRMVAKEEEMVKLKRQLMARTAASTSQTELETRIKHLTDQLIAKQSMIDGMEAERRSYEEWQSGVPGTASKPKRNVKRIAASSSGESTFIEFEQQAEEVEEGETTGVVNASTLRGEDGGSGEDLEAFGSLPSPTDPFQDSSLSGVRSRFMSRARTVGRKMSSKLNSNPVARKIASFFPRSVSAQFLLFAYLAILQLLVFYFLSSSSSSSTTKSKDPLLQD